jgi:hypothetical protein
MTPEAKAAWRAKQRAAHQNRTPEAKAALKVKLSVGHQNMMPEAKAAQRNYGDSPLNYPKLIGCARLIAGKPRRHKEGFGMEILGALRNTA